LHAAAVSDYLPQPRRGKISSKKNGLVLKLKRAPKIIKAIRQLNPDACLVMFKFEAGVTDSLLIKRATAGMREAGADMVIANTIKDGKYKGYILNGVGLISKCKSKEGLSKKLIEVLKKKI
jgi:phosphopantothenoylcysteine synthetase/decarboxylase